jgi:hypothetical protein
LDPACLLDTLFGWILSLCVDDPDPSYAYGDAWDMGGWMASYVRVMFFSGNQGISCILLEHMNKKNHLLKASDE